MATNPNNNVGTNAAYGGRTSPNAFNDVLAVFAGRGIVSGWACTAGTGMKVSLGADGSNRDVAIAEDNAGNKTTINNRNSQALEVTIAAAPASQSRIDAIVVYVNNPPQGTAVDTDNPSAIGVLDVQGTTASTPVAPNDSAIRTAITADGASGSTAYYVVLAYVTVVNGTTQISSNMITAGESAVLRQSAQNIADGSITTAKLADSAVTTTKIDNNAVSASKINWNGWAGTDVTSAITGVRGTIHNVSSVNKGYDGYYQIYMRIDTTNTVNANDAVATFNTTTMPLASDIFVVGVAPWYDSGTVCIWRFTTTGEIYAWQPGNNPFPTSTMITLNARFKYN